MRDLAQVVIPVAKHMGPLNTTPNSDWRRLAPTRRGAGERAARGRRHGHPAAGQRQRHRSSPISCKHTHRNSSKIQLTALQTIVLSFPFSPFLAHPYLDQLQTGWPVGLPPRSRRVRSQLATTTGSDSGSRVVMRRIRRGRSHRFLASCLGVRPQINTSPVIAWIPPEPRHRSADSMDIDLVAHARQHRHGRRHWVAVTPRLPPLIAIILCGALNGGPASESSICWVAGGAGNPAQCQPSRPARGAFSRVHHGASQWSGGGRYLNSPAHRFLPRRIWVHSALPAQRGAGTNGTSDGRRDARRRE